MENLENKDMMFTFVGAFKLAATTVISALPSDLSDKVAGTTSRKLADEINTNSERLKLMVGVIYTKAMEDETWSSTAVKLYDYLSLALSQPKHDAERTDKPLVDALLMCRYIHSTLQDDFQPDLQTSDWSVPRLWLLAELANCTSPIRLGPGSRADIARWMVESEFLLEGPNLELLLEYVYWVGAGVDEVPEREEELTEVLAELAGLCEREEEGPLAWRLMVSGLMWMRGNRWWITVAQDDELDGE
jgi:hypothetical protein